MSAAGAYDAGRRREKIMSAARRLRALDMGADLHGTPMPRALQLSIDAYDLFNTLRCEAMQRARDLHGLASGWHGKTPGRLLRLALTYELFAWAARRSGSHIGRCGCTRWTLPRICRGDA
jgi:hypothetical protein